MNEEQITNRYVRGMISLEEFRAEMVKFYDREDAKDQVERIVQQAYAERDREHGDPIQSLVRLAVRIALADAKADHMKSAPVFAVKLTKNERDAVIEALTRVLAGEHDGDIPIRFYEAALRKI